MKDRFAILLIAALSGAPTVANSAKSIGKESMKYSTRPRWSRETSTVTGLPRSDLHVTLTA